jgi:hypothetical protein
MKIKLPKDFFPTESNNQLTNHKTKAATNSSSGSGTAYSYTNENKFFLYVVLFKH